jgi:hypothetical protein
VKATSELPPLPRPQVFGSGEAHSQGGGEGSCEKIELAFIQCVPPFPRGDYRGGRRLSVPSADSTEDTTPLKSPLGKGGQPNVAVLIIDKHIFSHLQGRGVGVEAGTRNQPLDPLCPATGLMGKDQLSLRLASWCIDRETPQSRGNPSHMPEENSFTTGFLVGVDMLYFNSRKYNGGIY